MESERFHLTVRQANIIKRFFDDCFKLRENIYDGLLLEQMVENIPIERAFELLQSIKADGIEMDYRINEEPLGTFIGAIQGELAALAQLRTSQKVKNKLIAVCKAELGIDNDLQLFASLIGLGFSADIEEVITRFLKCCTLLELHQSFHLAHILDLAQYEQLVGQIRSLLAETHNVQAEETAHLAKSFSQTEVQTLINFIQQDFHVPLSQVEMPLLVKVAGQMPGLYYRLELQLQRG